MSKPLLKLTEKDLTARLKPALLTALKRDAGEFFKAHVNRALATWPEDAGLAAVRLVQLCGRIPSDALVAEIRGAGQAVKGSSGQGSEPNPSPLTSNPPVPDPDAPLPLLTSSPLPPP